MKEIIHENISTFMGACVDAPNICILTSYYSKGSLQVVNEFTPNLEYIGVLK